MYRYLLLVVFVFALSYTAEAQQKVEPIVQLGHATEITYLSFTPDEKYLLSADKGVACLWNVETGIKVCEFNEFKTMDNDDLSSLSLLPIALSPHGKYVFVQSDEKIGGIYSTITGKRLFRCILPGDVGVISACAFHPDGEHFLTSYAREDVKDEDYQDKLIIWDLIRKKGNYIPLPKFSIYEPAFSCAAFSPDGKKIAVAKKESVAIIDFQTRKILKTFNIARENATDDDNNFVDDEPGSVTWINSMVFSPDGKELAVLSEGLHVNFWNLSTGRRIETEWYELGSYGHILQVQYTPDGRRLVYQTSENADDDESSPAGYKIFEIKTNGKCREIATIPTEHTGSLTQVVFSAKGNLTATGGTDRTVFVHDKRKGKTAALGSPKSIPQFHSSPDKDLQGAELFQCDTAGLFFDAPTNRLYVGERCGRINVWDMQQGKMGLSNRLCDNIFIDDFGYRWTDSLKYRVSEKYDLALMWFDGHDGSNYVVWDKNNGAVIAERKLLLLEERFFDICNAVISSDGSQCVFLVSFSTSKEVEEQKYILTWHYELVLVNLTDGSILKRQRLMQFQEHNPTLENLQLEWNSSGTITAGFLKTENNSAIIVDLMAKVSRIQVSWNLNTNRITKLPPVKLPDKEARQYLESSRAKEFGTAARLTTDAPKHGIRFETSADGGVRMIDSKTGELYSTLYTFNGGNDWLVIAPSGLFDGTPGARRLLAYRVGSGLNVQPVEAFFQDFYYPGLLAAIWKGERPKPAATLKEQLPPEIRFVTPTKSGEVNVEKAAVEVVISDQGGGIKSPHVTLNGVGIRVRTKPTEAGKTVKWKFELPLIEGENTIVVHSATADGQIACESTPVVLHNRRHEAATPSLYVLAVGISDYQGMSKLLCARVDAEVLAEVFKRRGQAFYGAGKVHVRTLLDAQATAAGIERAMKEIAAAAKPEDVFVLTLAGHGATVGSLYHFLPYEFTSGGDTADNLIKKQGIANDVLQDWLTAIPAMKRFLIYDTCQTGAVTRGDMEYRKAMESISKMTGSYTICAAAGKEAAYELPDVGHGALTYALLAGLGEAKKGILQRRSVVSSDGIVRVRELVNFAQDEVPKLTSLSFGTEQKVEFSCGGNNFPLLGKP